MSAADLLARVVLSAAVAWMQGTRPDWARALRAEAAVPPTATARLRFAVGAARAALAVRPPRLGTVAVVGLGVAALILVDRSSAEIANQASMLVLLVASGVGGARAGRLWPLVALAVGLALTTVHLVMIALGAPPAGMEPPGYAGALTLVVLVIPAAIAAGVGRALAARP